MKKLETFLLILSVIAVIANISFIKGSGPLMIVGLGSLASYYFLMTKKWTSESLSSIDNFKQRLMGWGLSITVIGILFTLMIWPQSGFFLMLGTVTLLLATFLRLKTPVGEAPVDNRMRPKAIVFALIGITLLLVPKRTWIEYKFKDYPDYVNAWKQSDDNPRDKDLRMKREAEYKKMMEQKHSAN